MRKSGSKAKCNDALVTQEYLYTVRYVPIVTNRYWLQIVDETELCSIDDHRITRAL